MPLAPGTANRRSCRVPSAMPELPPRREGRRACALGGISLVPDHSWSPGPRAGSWGIFSGSGQEGRPRSAGGSGIVHPHTAAAGPLVVFRRPSTSPSSAGGEPPFWLSYQDAWPPPADSLQPFGARVWPVFRSSWPPPGRPFSPANRPAGPSRTPVAPSTPLRACALPRREVAPCRACPSPAPSLPSTRRLADPARCVPCRATRAGPLNRVDTRAPPVSRTRLVPHLPATSDDDHLRCPPENVLSGAARSATPVRCPATPGRCPASRQPSGTGEQ